MRLALLVLAVALVVPALAADEPSEQTLKPLAPQVEQQIVPIAPAEEQRVEAINSEDVQHIDAKTAPSAFDEHVSTVGKVAVGILAFGISIAATMAALLFI